MKNILFIGGVMVFLCCVIAACTQSIFGAIFLSNNHSIQQLNAKSI